MVKKPKRIRRDTPTTPRTPETQNHWDAVSALPSDVRVRIAQIIAESTCDMLCMSPKIQMTSKAWRQWALDCYAEEARAFLRAIKKGNHNVLYVPETHGLLYRLIDNLQRNPRAPGEHRFFAVGNPSTGKSVYLCILGSILRRFGRIASTKYSHWHGSIEKLRIEHGDEKKRLKKLMAKPGGYCYLQLYADLGTDEDDDLVSRRVLQYMLKDWMGEQNVIWLIELQPRPAKTDTTRQTTYLHRFKELRPALKNLPLTEEEDVYWKGPDRNLFGFVVLPRMNVTTFKKMLLFEMKNDKDTHAEELVNKLDVPIKLVRAMGPDLVGDLHRAFSKRYPLCNELEWQSAVKWALHKARMAIETKDRTKSPQFCRRRIRRAFHTLLLRNGISYVRGLFSFTK